MVLLRRSHQLRRRTGCRRPLPQGASAEVVLERDRSGQRQGRFGAGHRPVGIAHHHRIHPHIPGLNVALRVAAGRGAADIHPVAPPLVSQRGSAGGGHAEGHAGAAGQRLPHGLCDDFRQSANDQFRFGAGLRTELIGHHHRVDARVSRGDAAARQRGLRGAREGRAVEKPLVTQGEGPGGGHGEGDVGAGQDRPALRLRGDRRRCVENRQRGVRAERGAEIIGDYDGVNPLLRRLHIRQRERAGRGARQIHAVLPPLVEKRRRAARTHAERRLIPGGDGLALRLGDDRRRRGHVKLRLRDDRFGFAGAGPAQHRRSQAALLVIIHLKGIGLAGHQFQGPAPFRRGLVHPLINQQLAVNPEPRAVIGLGVKSIGLAVAGLHLSGPAHGVGGVGDRGIGRAGAPIKVNGRIGSRQLRIGEIQVVKILALEPRARARGEGRRADHQLRRGAGDAAAGVAHDHVVKARLAELRVGNGVVPGGGARNVHPVAPPLVGEGGGAIGKDAERGAAAHTGRLHLRLLANGGARDGRRCGQVLDQDQVNDPPVAVVRLVRIHAQPGDVIRVPITVLPHGEIEIGPAILGRVIEGDGFGLGKLVLTGGGKENLHVVVGGRAALRENAHPEDIIDAAQHVQVGGADKVRIVPGLIGINNARPAAAIRPVHRGKRVEGSPALRVAIEPPAQAGLRHNVIDNPACGRIDIVHVQPQARNRLVEILRPGGIHVQVDPHPLVLGRVADHRRGFVGGEAVLGGGAEKHLHVVIGGCAALRIDAHVKRTVPPAGVAGVRAVVPGVVAGLVGVNNAGPAGGGPGQARHAVAGSPALRAAVKEIRRILDALDQRHVMRPVPIGARVGMGVAIRIDAQVRRSIRAPRPVRFFPVPHNMIPVLGKAKLVRKMPMQLRRGLVHLLGEPGRVAHKSLVLRAQGMLIPTRRVPGIIRLRHQLRNFAPRRIPGIIHQPVHCIVATDRNITTPQIGGAGQVVPLHAMHDGKLVAVAGGIPFGATSDHAIHRRAIIGGSQGG
ncbi:MAG: hypothetical protein BWX68_02930 [Verrucomicrobia bacterium ADurb.Bin063]|nr:MAG: hypothetical protein BWX68_02930 [Verrucomicrobia bacterium ADurb.Bin063]